MDVLRLFLHGQPEATDTDLDYSSESERGHDNCLNAPKQGPLTG